MKYLEQLKKISPQHAEAFAELAIDYYSRHLVEGKYKSPVLEKYGFYQIAKEFKAWSDSQFQQLMEIKNKVAEEINRNYPNEPFIDISDEEWEAIEKKVIEEMQLKEKLD